jgi:hypothetical protein
MARPRIARTQEEVEAIPLDQTIQVALTDETLVETEEGSNQDPQPQQQEVAKKPAVVEPDDEPSQPDVSALQKRIAELERAEKLSQERFESERKRAEEAERKRNEIQTENGRFQEEATQAQYDAIVNALEASKAEAETAERMLERAEFDADPKAKSDAYRRLARAEANITRLEDGKAAYENRIQAEKAKPKPEPVRADPFEAAIASMPPLVKDWMREHPDYMTDQRKNAKIQALHWDVLDEGHAFGTKAYVESMETKLGLREAPKPVIAQDDDEQPPQRTTVVTQAPPTREVPSSSTGKPSSTKVTLTPEEREIARMNNITEIEYARQKIKMQEAKKNGHYNERG